MNRLIITGNGFDLAHGKKTSFKDFILNYFCNAVNIFFSKLSYKDELLELGIQSGFTDFYPKPKPVTEENVLEVLNNINKNKKDLIFKFHSLIINRAYSDIVNINWVDLELIYFKVLLATKNSHQKQNQDQAIRKVNDQLDYLKEKLIEYLIKQDKKFNNDFDKTELIKCFTEDFVAGEIIIERITTSKPKEIYFINFNYTDTLDDYVRECERILYNDIDFMHIHGDLSNIYGEPIFGFGDELDKKYIEFEDENNNELFRHIKSFEYLKNANYFNLMSFIDREKFQVQIYGHSCGLTDRTMLNQIFEHENCLSIKIFYHEDGERNDFIYKTQEISRHFKDKGLMRKKIVPFEYSRPMPQPKMLK